MLPLIEREPTGGREGLALTADSDTTTPGTGDYFSSAALEHLTGTPASTWRYWASIGAGPASFKLGRRRVWKKSIVLAWLAEQEAKA